MPGRPTSRRGVAGGALRGLLGCTLLAVVTAAAGAAPARCDGPAPLPAGRTIACTTRDAGRYPYYLRLPSADAAGAPVLVSVHGISRNAREHASRFGETAAARGVVVVAPVYSATRFPGFQRLGAGTGERPETALLRILDDVAARTGADTEAIDLFGFSGGAQFAHRFAMHTPQRVRRLVLGAPGWYTFPDPGVAYPRGIAGSGFDPEAFLRIPSMVLVGADDTRRDGAFNRSRHIDRQQGRTRVERGRHWVAAMRSAARTAGLDTAFEFATLDGCGHSFGDCARRAGLVERALAFLLARPRPLATMTAGGKRAGRR